MDSNDRQMPVDHSKVWDSSNKSAQVEEPPTISKGGSSIACMPDVHNQAVSRLKPPSCLNLSDFKPGLKFRSPRTGVRGEGERPCFCNASQVTCAVAAINGCSCKALGSGEESQGSPSTGTQLQLFSQGHPQLIRPAFMPAQVFKCITTKAPKHCFINAHKEQLLGLVLVTNQQSL